jgi:hypothetical protein
LSSVVILVDPCLNLSKLVQNSFAPGQAEGQETSVILAIGYFSVNEADFDRRLFNMDCRTPIMVALNINF